MTTVATVAGLALIVLAARDIFDTLFHPHGRGVVSERLIRLVWSAFELLGRHSPRLRSLAGPIAFVTVILSWVALVVLGGALVIAPRMPEEFVLAPGLEPGTADGFGDAIYVSLVNLTSLGFGDLVPTNGWLRLLGPAQALIGLGLLTASVSWILSIYQVLTNQKSLAREMSLICETCEGPGPGLAELEAQTQQDLLSEMTSRLIRVRRDLLHFPIVLYFQSRAPEHELALSLGRMISLVGELEGPQRSPGLAFEQARFRTACAELLETVADEFLGSTSLDPYESLRLWSEAHGW